MLAYQIGILVHQWIMHACYEYGSIFCRLDTHASVKQIRRISPIWLVGRKFEIHNSIDIWIVQYKSIHFTNADSFTRLFTAINSDFHSDKNLITLRIAIRTVFKVLINSHFWIKWYTENPGQNIAYDTLMNGVKRKDEVCAWQNIWWVTFKYNSSYIVASSTIWTLRTTSQNKQHCYIRQFWQIPSRAMSNNDHPHMP